MANISMCKHEPCEKHQSCYRFLATPEIKDQVYMRFQNICTPENNFQWYWPFEQSIVVKDEK